MPPESALCYNPWRKLKHVKTQGKDVLKDGYARKIDYLRISVTDRCNLRCRYCMPQEGVPQLNHSDIMTYEEIMRFVRIAADAGITKVRLTGGEPLVRKGMEGLIRTLADSYPLIDLSLTTNGILLAGFATGLSAAGLKRVNISIDSLNPDTYRELTRGGDLECALQGMRAALEAGLDPVKMNVVLLKGINDSDEEIGAFIRLALREPVYVRFIEYMSPRGDLDKSHYISADRVVEVMRGFGAVKQSDSPVGAGPARYLELEGMRGKIGLISPISSHFCLTCNRLRLTAEGKLKPCLLSRAEVDVRSLLRSGAGDEEILGAVLACLKEKPRERGEDTDGLDHKMSRIGG